MDAPEPHQAVLRMSEACRLFGRPAVRWALRIGRWQRPHPRVVMHSGPLSQEESERVALAAGPPRSLLGGPTALVHHGLRGLRDDVVHLVAPHESRTVRVRGAYVHRSLVLEDEVGVGNPPRTTVERSVIDAASWATSDRGARTFVLAAVQQRLTTPPRLTLCLERRGPVRRRGLIRESIADAAGGMDSLPERDFHALLHRFGLPHAETQRRVRRGNGSYYLDAHFGHWNLSVEVDGLHHRDVVQSAADLRRLNELVIDGRRVLRFWSYEVRQDQQAVAATIRAALDASLPPRCRRS